jgi:hypothetical protein
MVATPLLEAGLLSRFAARAAAQESLPQALAGLALGAPSQERDRVAELGEQLAASRLAATASAQDCTVLPEGVIPTADDDGDRLTNAVESCLGTDYINADTADGIATATRSGLAERQNLDDDPLQSDCAASKTVVESGW